jgi:hypothetical protein
MKKYAYILGLLLMALFTACSDDEVAANITVDSSTSTLTFNDESDDSMEVTFSSTKAWTAASVNTWISVSPRSGAAGEKCTVKISITEDNTTGSTRSGQVVLASDGVTLSTITVKQEPHAEYTAAFEKNTYVIPQEGGVIRLNFSTNVPEKEIVSGYIGDIDWLYGEEKNGANSKATRASTQGYYLEFTPNANTDEKPRKVTFAVGRRLSETETDWLAYVTVIQLGTAENTSTDFSADKKTRVIQTHTKGNGIPIVMMGDGFLDTDVASGYYSRVMENAVDNLFTEEPLMSMRDYFDIYEVTAVSVNNLFVDGFETTFSCEWPEGLSSSWIDGDDETVYDYMSLVLNDENVLDNALGIVILNSEDYGGTTNFGYSDGKGNYLELAIAYVPVIDGLDSFYFRNVLQHEAFGHGFAKLLDEYSYEDYGAADEDEIKSLKAHWALGWGLNVDIESDPTKVHWKDFLTDSRFDGQGLGVFEGGDSFIKGVYRPTDNSIMNSYEDAFNAPSRQLIYNRIIREGTGQTPTYEEFVAYDLAHPYTEGYWFTKDKADANTRAACAAKYRPYHHPVFVNKALQKRK